MNAHLRAAGRNCRPATDPSPRPGARSAQAERINNLVEHAIQVGRSETRPWIYVGTALGFLAGVSLSIMISRLPAIADAIAAGGAW